MISQLVRKITSLETNKLTNVHNQENQAKIKRNLVVLAFKRQEVLPLFAFYDSKLVLGCFSEKNKTL